MVPYTTILYVFPAAGKGFKSIKQQYKRGLGLRVIGVVWLTPLASGLRLKKTTDSFGKLSANDYTFYRFL